MYLARAETQNEFLRYSPRYDVGMQIEIFIEVDKTIKYKNGASKVIK
jgi:hypothetical protein